MLAWSRSRVQKAASGAWALQQRVFEHLVDALEGRAELVALGLRTRFLAESRARSEAWGAAGARIASATALSGRLALLATAAVVALVVLADSRWRGALGVPFAEVVLFASITPAFAGIAQGLHGIARTERWLRLVARVVEGARPRAAGDRPPPRIPARLEFESGVVSVSRCRGRRAPRRLVLLGWRGRSRAHGSQRLGQEHLPSPSARARPTPRGGDTPRGHRPARRGDRRVARGHRVLAPAAVPSAARRRPHRREAAGAGRVRHAYRRGARPRRSLAGAAPRLVGPLEVRIDTLSVGQRQRVALARFLCRDAGILVLDEPDANLDREGIAIVAEILGEMARARTMVFAAHTPELVAIAGRTLTLEAGRLVREERREPLAVPARSRTVSRFVRVVALSSGGRLARRRPALRRRSVWDSVGR